MNGTFEVDRVKLYPSLVFISFAFFCLWDFYVGDYKNGYRIFDLFFALLLALNFLTTSNKKIAISLDDSKLSIICLIYFLYGLYISLVFDPLINLKVCLGLILGSFIFIMISSGKALKSIQLLKLVNFIILILSSALIIQFIIYNYFGILINYHALLKVEPRVFGKIFRPSGLFQEPSNHCITLLMLIVLKYCCNEKKDKYFWLGILSMALSQSLYGLFSSLMIVIFTFKIKGFLLVLCLFFTFLFLTQFPWFVEMPEVALLHQRFIGFYEDKSVLDRYTGMFNLSSDFWSNYFSILFGSGITNNYLIYGSSGYAFFLKSFGVFGTLLFVLFLIRNAPSSRRLIFLFGLSLVLAAAPIHTTMFFWAWLALIIKVT